MRTGRASRHSCGLGWVNYAIRLAFRAGLPGLFSFTQQGEEEDEQAREDAGEESAHGGGREIEGEEEFHGIHLPVMSLDAVMATMERQRGVSNCQ